jgi:hypothetical protein
MTDNPFRPWNSREELQQFLTSTSSSQTPEQFIVAVREGEILDRQASVAQSTAAAIAAVEAGDVSLSDATAQLISLGETETATALLEHAAAEERAENAQAFGDYLEYEASPLELIEVVKQRGAQLAAERKAAEAAAMEERAKETLAAGAKAAQQYGRLSDPALQHAIAKLQAGPLAESEVSPAQFERVVHEAAREVLVTDANIESFRQEAEQIWRVTRREARGGGEQLSGMELDAAHENYVDSYVQMKANRTNPEALRAAAAPLPTAEGERQAQLERVRQRNAETKGQIQVGPEEFARRQAAAASPPSSSRALAGRFGNPEFVDHSGKPREIRTGYAHGSVDGAVVVDEGTGAPPPR